MKARRSVRHRPATIAAAQQLLREAARRRLLVWLTIALGILCAAVACSDYGLLVTNLTHYMGSLPGDQSNAWEIRLTALSGVIAMTAFGFYAAQHEDSRLVRIVNAAVGWAIVLFVLGMCLLTAWFFADKAGDAGASGTLPAELTADLPSDGSFLQRLLDGFAPWSALCVGLIVLIQFYVAETVGRIVMTNLREIERLRLLEIDVRRYLADLEYCAQHRTVLLAEKAALEYTLTPPGIADFSAKCADAIQTALAPMAGWVTKQELLIRTSGGQTKVDIKAVKQRLAPLLALDQKAISKLF